MPSEIPDVHVSKDDCELFLVLVADECTDYFDEDAWRVWGDPKTREEAKAEAQVIVEEGTCSRAMVVEVKDMVKIACAPVGNELNLE